MREALTDLWLAGPGAAAMILLIFLPVAIVAILSLTDYQFGAPLRFRGGSGPPGGARPLGR